MVAYRELRSSLGVPWVDVSRPSRCEPQKSPPLRREKRHNGAMSGVGKQGQGRVHSQRGARQINVCLLFVMVMGCSDEPSTPPASPPGTDAAGMSSPAGTVSPGAVGVAASGSVMTMSPVGVPPAIDPSPIAPEMGPGLGMSGTGVTGAGGGFAPTPTPDRPSDSAAGGPAGAGSEVPGAPAMTPAVATDLSECMQPPQDASEKAVEAWTILNEIRIASGSSCMNHVPELSISAQSHCDYLAEHRGNSSCGGGHTQVQGCMGFTGATPQAREIAAGYSSRLAYSEVLLNIGDSPSRAIPNWLTTPLHRIPLLDPWTTDMGWGGGPGCDIIDIGRGAEQPASDMIVRYPYAGQTDVPVSFNGLESPAPPKPEGGWPSSYPVSIYAQMLRVSEHVLTKDGDATPLSHMWLDADAPEVSAGLRGYFRTTAILYGAPFEPNTTYRVHIKGTYVGGTLDEEWTFTTGAMPSRSSWF